MVTLNCSYCSKEFERPNKEFNRQQVKLGLKPYCCIGHAIAARNHRIRKGNPENLKTKSLDEFSPFRRFMCSATRRHKGTDLTVEYLKSVWDEQKGICPFTGMLMELRTFHVAGNGPAIPRQISLDRIDNDHGYVMGNVRFVSAMANVARQKWTDEQVFEFCRDVAAYQSSRLS